MHEQKSVSHSPEEEACSNESDFAATFPICRQDVRRAGNLQRERLAAGEGEEELDRPQKGEERHHRRHQGERASVKRYVALQLNTSGVKKWGPYSGVLDLSLSLAAAHGLVAVVVYIPWVYQGFEQPCTCLLMLLSGYSAGPGRG